MAEKSIVYVKTDGQGRIIQCAGGYDPPQKLDGWIEIDEGYGDRYNLCQGNYFAKALYVEPYGIPQYKLEGGKAVERTAEEIAADIAAQPEPEPTMQERLQEQIDALTVAVLEGGNS